MTFEEEMRDLEIEARRLLKKHAKSTASPKGEPRAGGRAMNKPRLVYVVFQNDMALCAYLDERDAKRQVTALMEGDASGHAYWYEKVCLYARGEFM